MPYVKLIFPPPLSQLLMLFCLLLFTLFPGVNIGGAGSYVYDTPANNNASSTGVDSAAKAEEKKVFAPKAPSKGKCEHVFTHPVFTVSCGSISTESVEKKLFSRRVCPIRLRKAGREKLLLTQ